MRSIYLACTSRRINSSGNKLIRIFSRHFSKGSNPLNSVDSATESIKRRTQSKQKWTLPLIPKGIRCPDYAKNGKMSPWHDIIPLAYPIGPPEWYDRYLADGMRNASRLAAQCLEYAVSLVRPGITTREVDDWVTKWAFSHGCYPSSLNYGGFKGSVCTSVDNVLSHGTPNE